ncbi:MAG: exosortase/archaeosortase family protein [Spirochaetales bacterium]|jgi:exosortase/archaeosortase family protein|nr:exosortase/archaeosortase family protein [Spirochaetales bacterium]
MGLFYWLDHMPWFQTLILEKVARLNADAAALGLSLLGLGLKQTGTTLISPSGTTEIARSCTGSFVFLIFAAAVIPLPVPWKSRLIGLFWGLVVLTGINLLRISLILLVTSRFPGSLWALHIIFGQVIVIASMLLFFLWWIKRAENRIFFSVTRSNRMIYKTNFLFIIGYLGGYWLYGKFLESPLGLWVKQMIDGHAAWLAGTMNKVFFFCSGMDYAPPSVELVEGCLSSPMVVFFAAMVFAWPNAWKKKLLIIFLGFIPFFYVYHLLRAILIVATLGIQAKEYNITYHLYGQIMLSLFLLVIASFFWRHKQPSTPKMMGRLLIEGAMGIVLGLGTVFWANRVLAPLLTEAITGTRELSYDPQQTISLMPGLQVFIWTTLMWIIPELKKLEKCIGVGLGIIGALLIFAGFITIVEIFQLTPHVGIVKLGVVLLPFLIYVVLKGRLSRLQSKPVSPSCD